MSEQLTEIVRNCRKALDSMISEGNAKVRCADYYMPSEEAMDAIIHRACETWKETACKPRDEEIQQLRDKLDYVTELHAIASGEYQKAKTEIESLRRQLDEAKKEIERRGNDIIRYRGQLQQAETQNKSWKEHVDGLEKRLLQAEADLKLARESGNRLTREQAQEIASLREQVSKAYERGLNELGDIREAKLRSMEQIEQHKIKAEDTPS